ncbi:MAG TPA: terminase family protein [Longimicrobiales bacterium]
MRLRLEIHEKQSLAFESPATEILYGGAAGGGKSHLMRVAALAWCVAIPGLQVYLFRRTSPDLFKNHMEGPTGFPALLQPWLAEGTARINYSKGWVEVGTSRIHLCHCQYEKDVYKYQGAEIHVLLVDELTHFTRTQYVFLRSRVRLGGLEVPEHLRDRFPRILCASNPGGVGHNWVKAMFVDPAPPMQIWRAAREDGGMLRQYIPARLEDNPSLLENDPEYETRLEGLGNPSLVRAMRNGDWNIVSGGMFDDVWDPAVHVLPPFAPPASWRIDRSLDWGSSKPFSVGWWTESDGTAPAGDRPFPRGSLIRIAEWYGWDGKTPNVGCRMSDVDVARGIVERERAFPWGARVKPGPADSQIFFAEPGRQSIADVMAQGGVHWTEADKRPGSRKLGWEAMRRMLRAAIDRDPDQPHLYVLETCRQFIRTVPVLPRSERDPDDVDTDAEDHVADETRYRIMAPKASATATSFRI